MIIRKGAQSFEKGAQPVAQLLKNLILFISCTDNNP